MSLGIAGAKPQPSDRPSSPARPQKIIYPESDGKPMAEGTIQYKIIVNLIENFKILYADRDDVFVAGDLFWYPTEGDNKTRQAPDTLVAIGRPSGDRGSYMQWEEGGQPPQIIFEIISPSNRAGEMNKKFHFYQRYGVSEYYVYNPDKNQLQVWERVGDELRTQALVDGNSWTSRLTGVRLSTSTGKLTAYYPDGSPFKTLKELKDQHDRVVAEKQNLSMANAHLSTDKTELETENTRLRTDKTSLQSENDRLKELLRQAGIELP